MDGQSRSSPAEATAPPEAARPAGATRRLKTVPAPEGPCLSKTPRLPKAAPPSEGIRPSKTTRPPKTVKPSEGIRPPKAIPPSEGNRRSETTRLPEAGRPSEPGADDPDVRRRGIRHDIRHGLGTIIMLASAVSVAADVGPASRERIDALIGETRWLDHLLRRLDEDEDDGTPGRNLPYPERVRVDEIVGEIVGGLRLASIRRVGYASTPAWAHIDPLALWRAVRNILDNACRIAGERVDVDVLCRDGWTVVQVDDDGPGFGCGPGGLASLGLGIVHDLVSGYGGGVELGRGGLGGARVRILLPSAARP